MWTLTDPIFRTHRGHRRRVRRSKPESVLKSPVQALRRARSRPPDGQSRSPNHGLGGPDQPQKDDPQKHPRRTWIRRSRARKLDGSIPQFVSTLTGAHKLTAPSSRFRSLPLPSLVDQMGFPISDRPAPRHACAWEFVRPCSGPLATGSVAQAFARSSLQGRWIKLPLRILLRDGGDSLEPDAT